MARPRTWTDDQLIAAVADARSWNEVGRAIGRGPNGAARKSAYAHAKRLGLDVSHLGEVANVKPLREVAPEWTVDQVTEAIRASRSWAEALRGLGVTPNAGRYRKVQRLVAKHGLSTEHFLPFGHVVPFAALPFTRRPSDDQLQRAAIAHAMAWFLERGYMTSVPVDSSPYDLITDSDEGIKRIQVKTTRTVNRSGNFHVGLTCHEYRGARQRPSGTCYNGSRPYNATEIDFFFIRTSDGAEYLLPIGSAGGAMSLTLDARMEPFRIDVRLPSAT